MWLGSEHSVVPGSREIVHRTPDSPVREGIVIQHVSSAIRLEVVITQHFRSAVPHVTYR